MGTTRTRPRAGRRTLHCAAALILWAIVCAPAFTQPPGKDAGPGAKVPPEKLTTEELIGRLQEESQQGIGSHATAWASGFIAIDEEPEFRGGMLGSEKPASSPVLRELVRRGVAALPKLLEHADDKRPTKLVIEHKGGFGAMWHSDEYDPRHADPKKWPAKVNTDKGGLGERLENKHAVRVGDLCFVAVGQVVNRRLSVVRYQPTACLVINSPVQTPALAEAVRKDWSGLTADQHKQSLTQDAYSKHPFATPAALKRLLFYYPKDGEALALKLLARPLYSDDAVWTFVAERLVKEDPARAKVLVREFGREHGEGAAAAIPFRLRWIYWETSFPRTEQFLADRDRAEKLLATVFPDYDPYQPPFIDGAEPLEQRRVVETIARVQSAELDKAVYRTFVGAVKMKSGTGRERIELDELALACISRLAGKGYDAEFRAFVSERIKAAELLPAGDAGRRTLDALRGWQNRLGK